MHATDIWCQEKNTTKHVATVVQLALGEEEGLQIIRDHTSPGTPIKISATCTVISDTPEIITKVGTEFMIDPAVKIGDNILSEGGKFTETGDEFTPVPISNGQKVSINVRLSFGN